MGWDELKAQAHGENHKDREKWVGAYIGALAVMLAVCSMGGANSTKEATLQSVNSTNMWAFFQAKNLRRNMVNLQIDELELVVKANPGMPPQAKADIEKKITEYKATADRLKSDPVSKEGLDELFVAAKALQADRDLALRRDPYFDFGQAFLQIAIVLASVALIAGGWPLLLSSFGVAALGALMTVNGFFLLTKVPFIE